MQVHTKSIYQKQFQFPDIAKFDYSVEQFDKIEAAEVNLNGNLTNPNLLDTYIQICHDVSKNLLGQYGEQWTQPSKDEAAPQLLVTAEDD